MLFILVYENRIFFEICLVRDLEEADSNSSLATYPPGLHSGTKPSIQGESRDAEAVNQAHAQMFFLPSSPLMDSTTTQPGIQIHHAQSARPKRCNGVNMERGPWSCCCGLSYMWMYTCSLVSSVQSEQ